MMFILFVLATIGMTEIITQSDIFQWVKDGIIDISEKNKVNTNWLINALNCSQCVGFWSGIVMGMIFISNTFWITFACGCAGSMIANLYVLLYTFVQSKTSIVLEHDHEQTTQS